MTYGSTLALFFALCTQVTLHASQEKLPLRIQSHLENVHSFLENLKSERKGCFSSHLQLQQSALRQWNATIPELQSRLEVPSYLSFKHQRGMGQACQAQQGFWRSFRIQIPVQEAGKEVFVKREGREGRA